MRDLRPFVVEVEGEIAGYADIQPNGYIDHFFVSGAYPRQGVGTLLMSRIHDEAKLLGISELTADVSKTAEPFFLHCGFSSGGARISYSAGRDTAKCTDAKKLTPQDMTH